MGKEEISLIPGKSPEEAKRIISDESYEWFMQRGKRTVPWEVKSGKIILSSGSRDEDVTDRIYNEAPELSTASLQLGRIFKAIEDDLGDFSVHQQLLTRDYWGFNRAADQWSAEEGQHGDAMVIIEEATGLMSRVEISNDYHKNKKFVWAPSHEGIRAMDIYGMFQEEHTKLDWRLYAETVAKEGAPTIARVYKTISSDEGFHGYVYDGFFKIFFSHDPEGTIQDLLDVAAMFRLPEHGLETSYEEDSLMFQSLGFNPRRTFRILENILLKTGSVTNQQITDFRSRFLLGLREEARQHKDVNG